MDQMKIGRFIAAQRKAKSLTQAQLAQRLCITDRAVSKWETGKSMPDSSIMLELCEILDITVNELLVGERIAMENYNKIAEQNLLEFKKLEEKSNQMLLSVEVFVGVFGTAALVIMILAAGYAVTDMIWRIVMIGTGILLFLGCIMLALKLERDAGYYACSKCGRIYVPTWKQHFFAMHAGRTRYMKCPGCGKRSWAKKVLTR